MITSGRLGQDWMGSVQVHDLRPRQRHDPHQVWEKYRYRYKYMILEPENCTIPTKCTRNTNTTLTNTKLNIIVGRRTAQIQSQTWKCLFDKYKQQSFLQNSPLLAENHRFLFDLLHLLGLLLDRMPRHLLPGDMIGCLLSINCQSHFVACLLSWVGQCQINSSSSVKEWATVCWKQRKCCTFSFWPDPAGRKWRAQVAARLGAYWIKPRGENFVNGSSFPHFLIFLIFKFSSFSYFPYFLFGSTSHYWNPSNRKKFFLPS